jgi:hypothetical protein
MTKGELKIPLNDIEDGADLCSENASQFCIDAEILCDNKSLEHALASCIFAIEELGKAVWLKTKAAYALKESKHMLILRKERPEEIFHSVSTTYLNEKGYRWKDGKKELKEVNPFYDHLSKLLIASNTLSIASHANVLKSIEGKPFQSTDEIEETIDNFLREAHEINFYRTDLRESALYVDYNQEKQVWSKGQLKITYTKLRQLIRNIETAIELNRQWKLKK